MRVSGRECHLFGCGLQLPGHDNDSGIVNPNMEPGIERKPTSTSSLLNLTLPASTPTSNPDSSATSAPTSDLTAPTSKPNSSQRISAAVLVSFVAALSLVYQMVNHLCFDVPSFISELIDAGILIWTTGQSFEFHVPSNSSIRIHDLVHELDSQHTFYASGRNSRSLTRSMLAAYS